MRRFVHLLILLAVLFAFAALALVALNLRGEDPLPEGAAPFASTPAQVERGRYLALAGNCAGCHTTRGGQPYAGGVGIQTPFGTVFASNLTPSPSAGIGNWSAAEFWRALHNGRSKDGRLLYPAFPYPNFTRVTREDSDAIFAFLRTQPSADTPNTAHRLRFPYDSQIALAAWRALYFEPGRFVADPARSADWNRGAYLVQGLGHCIACHGQRNSLGAIQGELGLAGGLIAGENWYAPSLRSKREAGVADWDAKDVVALLKTGVAPRGSVLGPMADVVYGSTQHLNDADLTAMATYLKELPASASDADSPKAETDADRADAARASGSAGAPTRRDAGAMRRGQAIYDQRCAYCHGDVGQGAIGAYPPLAGNRAVLMDSTANLVQVVRLGGFLPATEGNPRPYGMPPFGPVLDDAAIADVLTYIRGSWGNDAPSVTLRDMMRP